MAKLNQSVENTKSIEGMPRKLTTVGLKTEAQENFATGIKAGEISEEGIMFQLTGIEASKGKHGDFWFIRGIDANTNKEIEILTSSKLLMKLINDNYQDIINKIIVLAGTGQGFERQYSIDIIGPGNIKKSE